MFIALRSIGLFAVAFLIGMLVTALLKWPPQQSSDWASWMQALGSIVGIGIAIAVPAWQYSNARRQARIDAAASFRATVQAVRVGLALVQEVVDAVKLDNYGHSYFANRYQGFYFSQISILLNTVSVSELPTPKAVVSFMEARRDFTACMSWATSIFNEHSKSLDRFEEYIEHLTEAYRSLMKNVNALLNECGLVETGTADWSGTISACSPSNVATHDSTS